MVALVLLHDWNEQQTTSDDEKREFMRNALKEIDRNDINTRIGI